MKQTDWIYADVGDKTNVAVCAKIDEKLTFCAWMPKSSVPKGNDVIKSTKEDIGL
jgi:hypothetical protein